MIMADTALTPFDMGTFGSRTTPTMAPQIRRAAATARDTLLDLAAEKWKAGRDRLTIADGKITCAEGGHSIGFGELTKGQKLTKTINRDLAVARPAGQSVAKLYARDIVTGKHKYTPDLSAPACCTAACCARPHSAPRSSVSSRRKLPGVKVVRDGDFVGVAAPDAQAAANALRQLKAEWKRTPQPSGAALYEDLKKTASPGEGPSIGSIEQGMAPPTSSCTPLTPSPTSRTRRSSRARRWPNGTTARSPSGPARSAPSAYAPSWPRPSNIPEDRVRVIVPDTGSAYGGKHSGECAIEAARLASAAAKPVKLVWTREEEFTWAYFRPAGVIEVSSGARRDGTLTAWDFHNYNSGRFRHSGPLRNPAPAQHLPPGQLAVAPRLLSRPGSHGQPFRARIAHRRAGPRS